jgi:beta-galactosidase
MILEFFGKHEIREELRLFKIENGCKMNKTMKKTFYIGILYLASVGSLYARKIDYLNNIYDFIENPAVFELNREEGISYFIPEKHISPNGDFYEEKFNDKKWNIIRVPSN